MHDNSWLVMRLSIAILLISAFILASIITHIPEREDVARDAEADAPDLSASRASSNIFGYIFGVTPGLAITIVFGLTKPFRQTMSGTFGPRRWWGKRHGNTRVPAAQAGPSQVELLPFAEEPRMIMGRDSTAVASKLLPVTATDLSTRSSDSKAAPLYERGGPTGIRAGNHMHSDSSDSNKFTAPLL
ncbi:hypothetical protein Daus18300_012125 [Diaporthe australafricana]|uniref:Uncharacterized protein n=1 Tax=Diaporthe australafricana TaxID=127596 RepID=A0ABR3W3W4_9PEZI